MLKNVTLTHLRPEDKEPNARATKNFLREGYLECIKCFLELPMVSAHLPLSLDGLVGAEVFCEWYGRSPILDTIVQQPDRGTDLYWEVRRPEIEDTCVRVKGERLD